METKFFSYSVFTWSEDKHLYIHHYIVGARSIDDACIYFSEETGELINSWFVNEITLEEIERMEAKDEEYVTWI